MSDEPRDDAEEMSWEEARRRVEESLRPIDDRHRGLYEEEKRLAGEMEALRRARDPAPAEPAAGDRLCRACGGSGEKLCPGCTGSGRVYDRQRGVHETCPDCRGAGKRECRPCGGRGRW